MKNLTKLTALTLTAALALTACGSSAAATAPAAESAAGSTAEAASGDLLSEIRGQGYHHGCDGGHMGTLDLPR